ncbi:MAG: enoyl-CoA hydratase-related protein [Thiomonas sp.]
MTAELRAERQGDCLLLRLEHAQTRHTLTAALCAAVFEALTTAERDREIRAVVLTGTPHHFCSGLQDRTAIEPLHDCILALRDCTPLVVGAVEGQAHGAGAALALACDLLVAADGARLQLTDPALPEVDVGGAQWLAAQLLPRTACNEATLPGLGLGAPRLHQLGVVSRVCAPGASVQTALQLIEAIPAAAGRARKALPDPRRQDGELHRHLSRQLQPGATD